MSVTSSGVGSGSSHPGLRQRAQRQPAAALSVTRHSPHKPWCAACSGQPVSAAFTARHARHSLASAAAAAAATASIARVAAVSNGEALRGVSVGT